MSFRQRRVLIAAAALVIIAVVVVVLLRRPNAVSTPSADNTADSGPTVASAHAEYGPFVVKVRAQGRIGAPAGGEAKLAFSEAGVIQKIYVNVGDSVVPNQPLAELDTSSLAIDATSAQADATAAAASYGGGAVPRTAVASAKAKLEAAAAKLRATRDHTSIANSDESAAVAALRQAEGKVSTDQRGLDRAQQTYSAGVTALKDVEAARAQLRSDSADLNAARSRASSARAGIGGAQTQAEADYKQAVTDVSTAQAQVAISGAQAASAQAKYAQSEQLLKRAVLRSPEHGVVGQLLKHVGETVDPTQPVFAIGPSQGHVVTLTVSGADASLVHVGDKVSVVDPLHNRAAEGSVVAVVPSVDPSTQTATVVASAVPPGGASGDAVTATIDVATRRGIIVPAAAVVTDPQSGKTLVFVKGVDKNGNSKFASREVTVTASDDRRALVQTGVRSGEVVAAQGAVDLLAPSGGGG